MMDGAGVFVSFLNKLVMVPMFDWLNNSQGVILILRFGLWAPDKYFKSGWQKKITLKEHPAYRVLRNMLWGAISAKYKRRSPPVEIQWVPRIVHSAEMQFACNVIDTSSHPQLMGGEGDAGKWRPGDHLCNQLCTVKFCFHAFHDKTKWKILLFY